MREGRRIEVLCLAQDHVAQLPSQDVLGTRHPSPDVCCPLPPRGGMAGSRFPPGSQASPGISTIRWFSCPIALASCWIDRTVCLSQEAHRIWAEMLTPCSSARAAPFSPPGISPNLFTLLLHFCTWKCFCQTDSRPCPSRLWVCGDGQVSFFLKFALSLFGCRPIPTWVKQVCFASFL